MPPACCCAPPRRSRCWPTPASWPRARPRRCAPRRWPRWAGTPAAAEAVGAVLAIRRRELLRTAMAYVLGLAGVTERGEALTTVAEVTVAAALAAAVAEVEQATGPLPTRLAVIAMGRLGGREMGFASDADVLFVHDPLPGADEEAASRAAHAVAETPARAAGHAPARPGPARRRGPAARGPPGPAGPHPGLLPCLLPALVGVLGGAGPAAGRVRGRRCRGRRRVPGAGRRGPVRRGRDRRGVGPGDPADQGPHGGRADAARQGPGPEPEARAGRAGRRGMGGAAASSSGTRTRCPGCAPPGP